MRIVKADLHNHLRTGSYMKPDLFNCVIDKTREKLGAGGMIGIANSADHRYEDFCELQGYARIDLGNGLWIPEKDIMVLKVQEVQTREGHLLVLGLKKGKHLKNCRPIEETLEEASENGGISILAHPYVINGAGKYLQRNLWLAKKLHGIEVYNGETVQILPAKISDYGNSASLNLWRELAAKNFNIGAIATSDGHSVLEIGNNYTAISMPKYKTIISSSELKDALKKAIYGAKEEDTKYSFSPVMVSLHCLGVGFFKTAKKLGIPVRFEEYLDTDSKNTEN